MKSPPNTMEELVNPLEEKSLSSHSGLGCPWSWMERCIAESRRVLWAVGGNQWMLGSLKAGTRLRAQQWRGLWGSPVTSMLPPLPEVPSPLCVCSRAGNLGGMELGPQSRSYWWSGPCLWIRACIPWLWQEYLVMLKLPREMVPLGIQVAVLGGEHPRVWALGDSWQRSCQCLNKWAGRGEHPPPASPAFPPRSLRDGPSSWDCCL